MNDHSAVSRRAFLSAVAATAGAGWLAAHADSVLAAVAHSAAADLQQLPPLERLTPAEARELDAATALIVPTDETPGAREARVVYFIDKSLATFAADRRSDIDRILAELQKAATRNGASSFASLKPAVQEAELRVIERTAREAFETLRGMTLVGMLALPSYGGNHNKIGWKWIGFDDRFSWVAPYGYYDAKTR